MSKNTFKFAIGSTVFCIQKETDEHETPIISIHEVKIDAVHANHNSELYTVVDVKNDIAATVGKNELYTDKEALYKGIDKIFDI